MGLEHTNALGMFPDLQHLKSALSQLKATGFPMNNVSVVVEHLNSEDTTLAKLTEPIAQPENKFARDRTIERIEHGALGAGALGSVVGGLIAGLTTLTFSAGGAVLLVGMATGAFYGAVSGGLLGGAIGVSISEQQVKHYSDLLTQGYYLVAIEGNNNEIDRAESVLKTANIQDWMIFTTI